MQITRRVIFAKLIQFPFSKMNMHSAKRKPPRKIRWENQTTFGHLCTNELYRPAPTSILSYFHTDVGEKMRKIIKFNINSFLVYVYR